MENNNIESTNIINNIINNIDNYDNQKISQIDLNQWFRFCSKYGHLDLAKKIYQIAKSFNKPIDIHYYKDKVFRNCCKYGYHEFAIWLFELAMVDTNYPININSYFDYPISISTSRNHFKIVDWLFRIGRSIYTDCQIKPINIDSNIGSLFIKSCVQNKLEMAKLLYNISVEFDSTIKITNVINQILYSISNDYPNSENKSNLVRWLILLLTDSNQIHKIDYSKIFSYCCKLGDIQLMEHIIDIGNKYNIAIDYHTDHELPFRLICCYGHIDLLNWFYSKVNQSIEIDASDGSALILSSSNGFINVVDWLINHDQNHLLYNYISAAIYTAEMNNRSDIIAYLKNYSKNTV